MKQQISLFVVLVLCLTLFVASAAGADANVTVPTMVTAPATTEPTSVPTTIPTTIPTTVPTAATTTLIPTTEQTITIVTIAPGGGKGWIDTYCNVDGATVYFDGVPQGVTSGGLLSVAVSTSGTPVRQVMASKSGYVSDTEPLARMPTSGEHVKVYTTLNPNPTPTPTTTITVNGAIYASSSPAGAAIYMNGNFQGYSPLTIPNLGPGAYSMKAALNGYTPDVQTINVYSGATAPYYPTLQLSPPPSHPTGTVSVTSQPGSALVYVDGNYQGKAPLTVTLYAGSHAFRLSLPGYNDYSQSVYVNAGTAQSLNAILDPAVYGTVAITSMPGATVAMDSNPQGTIPSTGTLTLYNIANGNRLFKVSYPGYNDWLNSVYVQPNTLTSFTATLVPLGPNPTQALPTGSITVASAPVGAELYIDNIFRGYTPGTITDLAPGQHKILLKYTGYVDYTGTVTVNSGQITPVSIAMTPAPTPTPKSAPSAIVALGAAAIIAGLFVGTGRRK